MRLIAVIPIHNEAQAAPEVIRATLKHVDSVLVVDDGSTDESPLLLKDLTGAFPLLRLLSMSPNRGKSQALLAGFHSLLQWQSSGVLNGDDIALTLDGDGQHDPSEIPLLVTRIDQGADVVIGRRNLLGYPLHKRWGNRLLSHWGKLWAGREFTDLESGMRAFRMDALNRILPYLSGAGYSAEHETGVIASRLGLAIDDTCSISGGAYVSGSRARDGVVVMAMGALAAVRVRTGRPVSRVSTYPLVSPPLDWQVPPFRQGDPP